MTLLLASFLAVTNMAPAELVANCRAMIPADVVLEGTLTVRNRRGVVKSEHEYVFTRKNGSVNLAVDGAPYAPPKPSDSASDIILDTDVTWSDLTLDYLWWSDASFEDVRESETVHGQTCVVVRLKNGARTVRIWIDRKTGVLMQAEETRDGKSIRRLWGARIKKFGERWMANVMEVETVGSGHRTKISVKDVK